MSDINSEVNLEIDNPSVEETIETTVNDFLTESNADKMPLMVSTPQVTLSEYSNGDATGTSTFNPEAGEGEEGEE